MEKFLENIVRLAAEGREAAGRAAALGTQGLASWKKEKTHFSGEFSGYAASGSFIEGKWTKKARCKNNKKQFAFEKN